MFWKNFKTLKLASGLIPKLAPIAKLATSNFHYASFNSVEYKLRTKYGADISEFGLLTQEPEERKVERQSIECINTPVNSGSFAGDSSA